MTMTSSVLLPPGGQRILVIMAHPDDAEFICGGTIARLAAEGRHISYVLVTSGNRGAQQPDISMEQLAKTREDEQRHAASALGVQAVTFLGYNDLEVEVTLTLRAELALAIRRSQPDVLFTFDPWRPYEIHPDHRNVGACALDALAAARMPMYHPEQLVDGLVAHRIKQVYLFSTHQPNHWVDVSDYMEKQLEALHCHTSQMYGSGVDEVVRQRARLIGVEHGYAYGESFHHLAMR